MIVIFSHRRAVEAISTAARAASAVLDHAEGSAHFVWPELIAIRTFVGAGDDADRTEEFRKAVKLAGESSSHLPCCFGTSSRPTAPASASSTSS